MNDSIKEQLARMTPKEREYVMKAINDPDLIKDLYDIDFYEVPVTIDEFLTNEDFLGWATNNGKQIYDYWKEQMRDIFDPNNSYSEIALTGSIGCGKSHVAVLMLCYCLYKLMCLKDPATYFGLAKGSPIYIVFLNITVQLSSGVAYSKFMNLLLGSPWFMRHGRQSQGLKMPEYIPDNNQIRFTAGSSVQHVIGKDVYCLTGDTEIYTDKGVKRLDSIEDQYVQVYTRKDNGNISLCDVPVQVKKTREVTKIIELELEDGAVIKCTENHLLRCKDGTYIQAKDITEETDLDTGCFHQAGIYKITNLLNNKSYIGKSESDVLTRLNIKIKSKKEILLEEPVAVYDVINVPDTHNFLVKTNTGFLVSHNCFLMDELNFGKGSGAQVGEKSAMMELYNNVAERVRSRFIVDGKCVGKGFLVSSKKSDYDFLESYIKKQKDNPNVKVCDAVLWKIKPQGTYCGKKFHVAFGGSNMVSKIVDEKNGETIEDYERMGYSIEEVPVEFKSSFELDINAAIQNILGIVVSGNMKFITYNSLQNCINTNITNGFEPNIVTVGCKDKLQLRDFFHPEKFPEELTSLPIFIHLDCSLNGDRTGISAVAVMGYNYVNRYDIVSNTSVPTKELMFRDLFSLGIQAPAGDEISFQKTREFLYYLRNVLEWNIKAISTDGFQSADLRQQLSTMGFQDVSLVSLDRKPDGYLALKSAITEKRLMLPSGMTELEKELVELERDATNGKIDHTVTGCFTGDTKIQLVDGRVLTIEELLLEQEYRQNWVYTMNEEEHIIEPKPIKKVFQTKIAKELVEVTLDNGEKIVCTPEHKFMLQDGEYEEAQNLTSVTSLTPLYAKRKVVSVEHRTELCRVYDLEIQDNHNFALAAGVIVHNSKDIADGLAGALYNAALHNAEFTFAATEIFGDAISENLDSDEGNEDREMLLSSLITPLSQIAPRQNDTPEQQKQSRDAYNDYTDLLDDMIIF